MKTTQIGAAIAAVLIMAAAPVFAQGSGGSQPATKEAASTRTTSPAKPGAADSASMTAPAKAKLTRAERKFIEESASGGMKEVEFAKLATQQASDPAVKRFAEQMVKDHGDANQKLNSIAQAKGVSPKGNLKSSDQRELRRLQKLSGAEFDKRYVQGMVADHKHDAKAFEKQAKSATDPDVKKFATESASVIQHHLDMITDIAKGMDRGSTPASTTPGTTGGGASGSTGSTKSGSTPSTKSGSTPSGSATKSGSTGK